MAELKEVSDSWLGSRNEKGFSLGFFDESYIQRAPVAIVRDKDGKLVSFATLMPMEKDTLSIDLMRHRSDAPSGIMDKVFIELFKYGQENGYKYFDLGMAPLSNVGDSKYSFIEERVAHFIYEYGYKLYGFQGLKSFKNKYANEWHSKYTTYRKRSSIAQLYRNIHRRSQGLAYISAAWSGATIIGPLVGGWIVDTLTWS